MAKKRKNEQPPDLFAPLVPVQKPGFILHTDGACSGNPGPGGWAFVLSTGTGTDAPVEGFGHAPDTTNNRMELAAIINGIRLVPPGAGVEVVTDSQYSCDTIAAIQAGRRNHANRDLQDELADVIARAGTVISKWVRGHSGHPGNERANLLATGACRDGKAVDPVAGRAMMVRASMAQFRQPGKPEDAEAPRRAIMAAQIVAHAIAGRFPGLEVAVAADARQERAIMLTFEAGFPGPATDSIRSVARAIEGEAVEGARGALVDDLPAAPVPLLRTKPMIRGGIAK